MGRSRSTAVLLSCGLIALATAGCAGSSDPATSPAAITNAASSPAGMLSITDPWVKAVPEGMTGVFGVLTSTSDQEITVVSASTTIAKKVELHETVTVDGVSAMRPKDGGFAIPAGGSLELKPGANHIMLMGLTSAVEAGADVPVTLTLADGSTMSFTAIAKEFKGAQESYQPMAD